MREHTIIEARKMFKTHKVKAEGPLKHTISQIFSIAKSKSQKMPPGRYYYDGAHIYIDPNGQAHLECPDCGMQFDRYMDYENHQKRFHQQ